MLEVKINPHGNPMPMQYGEWIDLCTAEDVDMHTLDFRYISLGISLEVPEGYYVMVAPRSSTYAKHGIILANSIGIIEHDYSGDDDILHFPAIALRKTHIPMGTRIAQFCVKRQEEPVSLVRVDYLGNKSRGGLGSTGD